MIPELVLDLLRETGAVRLRVGGRSMTPLVPDRATVVIQRADPHAIRVSDTVLASTHSGKLLLHRVLWIGRGRGGRRFLLKGDRCPTDDGWFAEEAIAGRVTEVRRPGGPTLRGRPLAALGVVATLLSAARGLRPR